MLFGIVSSLGDIVYEGVAWLGGGALVGVLYEVSTTAAALAVTGIEAVALAGFALAPPVP